MIISSFKSKVNPGSSVRIIEESTVHSNWLLFMYCNKNTNKVNFDEILR